MFCGFGFGFCGVVCGDRLVDLSVFINRCRGPARIFHGDLSRFLNVVVKLREYLTQRSASGCRLDRLMKLRVEMADLKRVVLADVKLLKLHNVLKL